MSNFLYLYSKRSKQDYIRRLQFKKYEINKVILKSLIYSNCFKKNFRLYFHHISQSYSINNSISSLRTYCLISGSGKYVLRRFRLGRHFIKR